MAKHILVVDDEPAIARLVQMSLEMGGYVVRAASNALDALRLLEEKTPDLAVLDIMMPGMNGYDLCRAVKRFSPEATRIIFVTARANPCDIQFGYSLGADDYMVKPFDPEELLQKVRQLIGDSGA